MTGTRVVLAIVSLGIFLGSASHGEAQTWRYATADGRGGFVRNTGPSAEGVRLEVNCDDGGGALLMSLDLLRPNINEGIRSLTFQVDQGTANQGSAYPTFHEDGWMNWTVVYGGNAKGPLIDSFRRGNVLQAEMIDMNGMRKLFTLPLDGFSAAWGRCP